MRWLDYACGAGLLALVGLKCMAADFGSDALVVLAAVAEACLAISFLVRRTPRVSAVGLVALGAAFCAWTLIRGPELKSGRPCGCYGPYRLEFLPHLAVASGILIISLSRLKISMFP